MNLNKEKFKKILAPAPLKLNKKCFNIFIQFNLQSRSDKGCNRRSPTASDGPRRLPTTPNDSDDSYDFRRLLRLPRPLTTYDNIYKKVIYILVINVLRFTQNVNKRWEINFYDQNICYDLGTKFFEQDSLSIKKHFKKKISEKLCIFYLKL